MFLDIYFPGSDNQYSGISILSLLLNSSVFFTFLSLKFFLLVQSILLSAGSSTEIAYENKDELDANKDDESDHFIVLLWLVIN